MDFLATSGHLGWSELVKMAIFENFNGTTELSGEFGTKCCIECPHSIASLKKTIFWPLLTMWGGQNWLK